ncbi:hypothetical protein ACMU_08430 [Actibacterium mucosum KCTC 23349]|uniref:DUF1330 domain-containing protein n=1 Tax=Actibacterium mucosum KCTC 23349 TaxID=1454373 RepID=A0A037ZI53_9RHOB|nr:hypothetical protein [Actibacterium mucosum]KAJ55793.1 hypothetical protein ACMU_08430 [Actibacterium mucosum KCTC 23349]
MSTFLILDILKLKPGKTPAEAVAYFDSVKPVFDRHGLVRSDVPLTAMKALRGTVEADVVNFWETENPEVSMKGMAGDPEYQAQVPVRDTIFDLDASTILLTKRG